MYQPAYPINANLSTSAHGKQLVGYIVYVIESMDKPTCINVLYTFHNPLFFEILSLE
jgi:hypothetical protein